MAGSGGARKVVEFWRAVEMFSPPEIPAVDPERSVYEVDVGRALPWDPEHPARRRPLTEKQALRHTVYLGVFRREAIFAALREAFARDEESYDERQGGESALLAFSLTADGKLLKDSIVVSGCAWATSRALDPGPDAPGWLDGFDEFAADRAEELEESYIGDEDWLAAPLDHLALEDCLGQTIEGLGIPVDFPVEGIRVRSEVVAKRNVEVVEHDFLNSFIAADLGKVARAAGQGRAGAALDRYLRPGEEIDRAGRVDARTDLEEIRRRTHPDRVPLGRWPAAPDRALALGQQLAVNEAASMRRSGEHLLAVNGPPGTGKTTMLRDLIAAQVTERAAQLARFKDPLAAFVGEPVRWRTANYRRTVHRLRPELTGYEMVVASSNNGAVDNVTLEIPSAAAIDPDWGEEARDREEIRLLAERAMRAGNRGKDDHAEDIDAWALIAARLGNSENRRDFVSAVWWTGKPKRGALPPPRGLRELLVGWEKHPDGPTWAAARSVFRNAHRRVVALREERGKVATALDRMPGLEEELAAAQEAERVARDRVIASRPRRDELTAARRTGEEECRNLVESRDEHRRHRPFFLRLFARAAWRRRDRELTADLVAAEAGGEEIDRDLRPLEAEVDAYEEARGRTAPIEAALADARDSVERYRAQPGAVLPDAEWHRDRRARELRAPWTDDAWNRARTELFLAALDLHRAFLVGAAQEMRQCLDGAMDVIGGAAPRDLRGDAALAAWQAFFLLVPVVSTTFASVARLFAPLGPEALGLLLVDEAGQATPQNAAGAIWRCRRAVVVGDPLQLEPITTIPLKLEASIRLHHGVAEEWLTSDGSVQTLADRQNRLGTELPGAEDPVWVGTPLTVHRRCDQPMFDLANEIAYDGLMIDATDPGAATRFAEHYPGLPESKWIDVSSLDSAGHWIPAEGVEVDRILDYLDRLGFDFRGVMAIGPFRDVARQLARRIGAHRGLRAGTIHTAQGKEADVVLLVLGSDPSRDGARAWAASRPNLLNVAVSRARRRLYVVGDREAWRRHRYFGTLADRLPHTDSSG